MSGSKIVLTAQQVYDKLLYEDKIKTIKGQIRFHLGDVDIIVKKKDIVGNVVQEWLEGWLVQRNVDFKPNPQSQMPPDIFLNTKDLTKNWLEVKAFNRDASPAFDIADFKAFVNELIEKPYHLDTDYIIFGYVMDEATGDIVIKDLWLKKIWEITKTQTNWPITCQFKNGVLQKMRPGNWFTNSVRSGKVFESKEDYLSAFEETVYQCSETRGQASQWKNRFKRSYRNYYGTNIEIPRWDDIKDKYCKH